MMLALGLVLVSIFLIVQISASRSRTKNDKRKYLPGPVHLPVIGALIQFGIVKLKTWNLNHNERCHELCKRYGKTTQGWAGQFSVIITESLEVAKEILHSPDFTARFPTHPRFRELSFCKNLGLLMSSHEPWKEMRRYSIKALKTYGFGELKSTEVFLDEELDYFIKFLDKDRKKNNDEIYMHQYFNITMFNTIWRAMSGSRYELDDAEIHRIVAAVEQASKMEVGFDVEWVYPCLRYVPGFSKCWQQCKSCLECQAFFKDIMDKRRESGTFKESQTNFIDYFLKTVEEEKKNPDTIYTDEQFIATCCDLLYTGVDTTANAAEFTILYMLQYPHVQRAVQAEIDQVIDADRIPNYSDIKMMPYTKALLLEVLRVANITPMICRTSTSETTLDGCYVAQDLIAGINLGIIHTDPKTWGDPENFRPERFLDANNCIINEDKLFVFGAGKRMCPGNTMAKVMWFKFITTLLQKYNFERSPVHPKLTLKPNQGVVNTPKPFYCMVTPRESKTLVKNAN